ncbi:helix-turn-helix domain-containing protein [Paenibacillus contaminans]|uniref:Helix-turn-helix domain-containing protein n=1 Tax=Paenibacillus contaminans TaxID=450362 RepID=A0A329MS71_9BACL|nr:helix-turn-helix domain-containing protein [Paenibacillus contaminans]RAV22402.1 helix-turn-helix domain-containing protein [Paenibacillus contaminans]
MAEIKKTYSVEEKRIAVELYNRDGLPFSEIARKLNIPRTNIRHWVTLYEREGLEGLEEKRGKAKGLHKGRKRKDPLSIEEELVKLRAENEYLKKLWELQRGKSRN